MEDEDSLYNASRKVREHVERSAPKGAKKSGGKRSETHGDLDAIMGSPSGASPPRQKKAREEAARNEEDGDHSRVNTPRPLPPARSKRIRGGAGVAGVAGVSTGQSPKRQSPKRQSPRRVTGTPGKAKSSPRHSVAPDFDYKKKKGAAPSSPIPTSGRNRDVADASGAGGAVASIPDPGDVLLVRDLISHIEREISDLKVSHEEASRANALTAELNAVIAGLKQKFSLRSGGSTSAPRSRAQTLRRQKQALEHELQGWEKHLQGIEHQADLPPIDWNAEVEKRAKNDSARESQTSALSAVQSLVEAATVVMALKTQIDGIQTVSKRVQELQHQAADLVKKRDFPSSKFLSGTPKALVKGSKKKK